MLFMAHIMFALHVSDTLMSEMKSGLLKCVPCKIIE